MATSTASLHESQQPKMIAIFTIFFILPVVVVGLRILSRRLTRMDLWWDDWLILVATAILCTNYAFLILGIHSGAGKHIETVTDLKHREIYLITIFSNELIYASIVTTIKASILCLYLRIFGINKTFAKFVYAFIVVVIFWGIATFFSTIFQCNPIQAAWIPTLPGGKCFNLRAWLVWTNVPNIIIDCCILVLPIPLVWGLKLSRSRRVSLCGVFLVGVFTIVCSIVRVTVNSRIDVEDVTWSYVACMIWSTIEGNVGVICACLPVLAPVLHTFAVRFGSPPSSSAVTRSKRAYRRSSVLEDSADLAPLGEDTTQLFPIRKTIEVETVAAKGKMDGDAFDARRPGDT